MKVTVYSTDGKKSRKKEFKNLPVLEGDRGRAALRQYLLAYQANQRQGNASTKTRDEVSGTGKKPWRQKGTGRARAGSRRSPIFTGGGVAFGPQPRDFSQKVNRKMKLLAFQRALFERAQEGDLAAIESWEISEPKTRLIHTLLQPIAPIGAILLVDDAFDKKIALATRNLQRIDLSDAASLNPWHLARYAKVIFSEKSLNTVLIRAQGTKTSPTSDDKS